MTETKQRRPTFVRLGKDSSRPASRELNRVPGGLRRVDGGLNDLRLDRAQGMPTGSLPSDSSEK